MNIITKKLNFHTRGDCDIIDITQDVSREVGESGLEAGTATAFVSGSTAGLTTVEYESGLVSDLQALFDRLAPRGIDYGHNLRWGMATAMPMSGHLSWGPLSPFPLVRSRLCSGPGSRSCSLTSTTAHAPGR